MIKVEFALTVVVLLDASAVSQTTADGGFKLALPDHQGQLRWSAEGFKIVQSSARQDGREIGIRAEGPDRLTFLGFLFLFPEQAPLTSAKCRDGVLEREKKINRTLKVLTASDIIQPHNLPVSVVSYTSAGRGGSTVYMVRGFVAIGDVCGDLEI